MSLLDDVKTVRRVLKVADQHGIDRPGMGFVAPRRIGTAPEAAEHAYQGWLEGNDVWGPMQALREALDA